MILLLGRPVILQLYKIMDHLNYGTRGSFSEKGQTQLLKNSSISSVPWNRKHKCLFLYCLETWLCGWSTPYLLRLHGSRRKADGFLGSGNSGVSCDQQATFWHHKVVGCSWELRIWGRTPGFKWARSSFSSFPKVCLCQVKSRSNLFNIRLEAESQNPFLWESWPIVVLLCARGLWGCWFLASVIQGIGGELPWATGLQKRNSCLS